MILPELVWTEVAAFRIMESVESSITSGFSITTMPLLFPSEFFLMQQGAWHWQQGAVHMCGGVDWVEDTFSRALSVFSWLCWLHALVTLAECEVVTSLCWCKIKSWQFRQQCCLENIKISMYNFLDIYLSFYKLNVIQLQHLSTTQTIWL